MSNKAVLSKRYNRFFEARKPFILSPYTSILYGNVENEIKNSETDTMQAVVAGSIKRGAICAILTIIPILPTMVAVAFVLSALATFLALLSMAITYPIAEAMDYCSSSSMGM